jgi:hypothetical protein
VLERCRHIVERVFAGDYALPRVALHGASEGLKLGAAADAAPDSN